MFTCLYCDSVYKHAKQGYNQYPAILTSDSNVCRPVSYRAALVDKNDHTPTSPQEKMLRLVLDVPKKILCKDGTYLY